MLRRFLALALAAPFTFPSGALAQSAPAPASVPASTPNAGAPVLSPPTAQGSTDVPYPSGARGDATVLLVLDLDASGRVTAATVIAGNEPFAEQARRAVLSWQFTPARRGATPVAARIRARVDFHQDEAPAANPAPAAVTPGESASRSSAATESVPAATEPPLEITVLGARREIGETTLSAPDVKEMPGAFGDPFRAIEALPSVIPMVSGLPFFYIRGAPPTNNAYLVDGIRVPLLFHVGIGEGVLHPALIDHVDFYPGVAPAEYGGSAGAVIAGQTRDPATTRHGEINVRLIDAGALLESPFGDERGSALVAGRYGYPGPILSAVTSTIKLGYWDYQTRVTWKLSAHDTIALFAFGSHDYLGTANTNNGQVGPIVEQLGSDFHRLDLRYDHALSDGRIRSALTFGYDSQGGAGDGDNQAPVITKLTSVSGRARVELDTALSPAVRFRGGLDGELAHYHLSQIDSSADAATSPQVPSSADPPPTNLTAGAHAELILRPTAGLEIVPGVRFDVFDSTRSDGPSGARVSTVIPAVEPRLATRVTFTRGVTWISTLGISHQYPVLRVGAIPTMLLSEPGFPVGDSQLQTVAQESQGLEIALPASFTLTATGFFSEWSGLTDLSANCVQIMPAIIGPAVGNGGNTTNATPWTCPSNDPVHGVAFGGELLLRRPLSKRLTGWLSYTLSRSTRDEYFITPSGAQVRARVASDYDRTHLLNAILGYDLGAHWRAGGRLVFYTGVPYSALSGNVAVPPYNSIRTPPFYRIDLRLEKRWPFADGRYVSFITEIQNATLHKEVTPLGLDCMGMQDQNGGTNDCKHNAIGPLTLPSVGVEAAF